MTNLTKSQLIPLAIPSRGMSTRYPIVQTPPEYSSWIKDMDNEGGFFESRKGVRRLFNASSNYVSAITQHPTNKNRVLFLDTDGGINTLSFYDAISSGSADIATSPSAAANSRVLSLNFNKNAFFFLNGAPPLRYDGTTYGPTGYTGPNMSNVVFGFPYKSRMYLVESMSTSTWYGTIAGVTGPTRQVDWASLTKDNGIIMCGFGFTLSSGLNSESLFSLIFDTGEMLVYSGNYPDDVTSWKLVATARIGSPVGYQSIIEQNGDVLVLTKNGIVSCRELLTTAQGDVQAASITSEIEKYWTLLIAKIQENESLVSWTPTSSLISYINGSFHQQRNKLAIFVPKYLSPSGSQYIYENAAAVLVYDIPTKSWAVHVPRIIGSAFQFISSYYWPTFGKLLFGTNDTGVEGGWEYWGRADYRDQQSPTLFKEYFPEIRTAFTNLSFQGLVKGIFITHQGTYSKGMAAVQILGDSGSLATGRQNIESLTNAISRDFYNVGLTAENFSVIISSSTDVNGSMSNSPYKIISITAQVEITRSTT